MEQEQAVNFQKNLVNLFANMNEQSKARIGVFIDAENISYKKIDLVISELANHGVIKFKFAYANWAREGMDKWKSTLEKHSIRTVQQFDFTASKNASDMRLVIDAMKILHMNAVDAFCIVSSDSDFTPLVQEIRSNDIPVYGFGESKTPSAFVNSCTKFYYIDKIINSIEQIENKKNKISKEDLEMLTNAVISTQDDTGWSDLAKVGNHLSNSSSFEPKNYGKRTLGKLFESSELFEIKIVGTTKCVKLNKEKKL